MPSEIELHSRRVMDMEANIFAAHLLMPEELFMPMLEGGFDIEDDEQLEKIAKRFRVSKGAVFFRIMLEMKLRGW